MGLVQQTTGVASSAGSTLALTSFGAAPTQGNVVVVMAGTNGASGSVLTGVTQTGVSGWTKLTSNGSGSLTADTWIGSVGDAAAAAITVNIASGYSGFQVNAWSAEFPGFTTTIDGTPSNNTAFSATASSGSVTTSYPFDLLLANGLCNSQTLSAPTNGFVAGTTAGSGTFCGLFPSYQIVAANQAWSTGWTVSSSDSWLMTLCAVKSKPAATTWPPQVILPPG